MTTHLPPSNGEPEASSGPPRRDPRSTGHVLLVEDDDRIRRVAINALSRAGFSVREASSGEEALTLLEGLDDSPLLITDVVMPGMRGPQVAEAVRERFPDTKVLFISGYSSVELGDWDNMSGNWRYLAKPFLASELLEEARELMTEAS